MKSVIVTAAFVLGAVFGAATARAEAPAEDAQGESDKSDKAKADKEKAKAAVADAFGMCMGLSTRCDLLPKGICFMQAGCFNPMYGDRCGGSAKQCTGFNTKNACMMQRGCTWVKQKK